MSTYEFTLSLRIRHPTVDPQTITQMLGIEPQHAWQRGAPRRGTGGEECGGIYRESYWTARLMPEPLLSSEGISVESYLMKTVSSLQRSHAFLEQLNADGGVAELYVSLFARGNFHLDLSPESLSLIGRLRLAVALDVHLHMENEVSLRPSN